MSPRRSWLLAWLGGPLIGIANGTLRELAYKDRVGELAAHQISTGSAIGLFAGSFELLERRRPLASTREALQVGAAWLALAIAFEFGFGRGRPHVVGGAARGLRRTQGSPVVAGAALDRARSGGRPRRTRAGRRLEPRASWVRGFGREGSIRSR
jgi:hypothetical protein